MPSPQARRDLHGDLADARAEASTGSAHPRHPPRLCAERHLGGEEVDPRARAGAGDEQERLLRREHAQEEAQARLVQGPKLFRKNRTLGGGRRTSSEARVVGFLRRRPTTSMTTITRTATAALSELILQLSTYRPFDNLCIYIILYNICLIYIYIYYM